MIKNGFELNKQTQPISKVDSRQIKPNMKSINNPKKKGSNRKKMESFTLNKSNKEIVGISNVRTTNMCLVSGNTDGHIKICPKEITSHDVEHVVHMNEKTRGHGRPQRPDGSELSFEKSTSSTLDIYSPKKEDIKIPGLFLAQVKAADIESSEKSSSNSSKVNAFTIMMNRRNRSIGLIQSGAEFKKADDFISNKAKSRLLDQDRGGSAKRKFEETQKDEYVLYQLEKRSKRLKNITKKIDAKKEEKAKSEDRVFHSKSTIVDIYSQQYRNSDVLYKAMKVYNRSERFKKLKELEFEDNTEEVDYLQNTSRLDKLSSGMSSMRSGNKTSDYKGSDFIKKPSSPIKKKDSLFGYFHKINASCNNEVEEQNTFEKTTHGEDNTKKSKPANRYENVNQVAKKSVSCESNFSIRPQRSCFDQFHSGDYFCVCRKMIIEQKENKNISSGFLDDKIQQSPVFKQAICANLAENRSTEERTRNADSVFKRSIRLNSSILKARKEFLMSEIPEKIKMEIVEQRKFDECYNTSLEVFFPKISHVGYYGRYTSIYSNRNIDWRRYGFAWREFVYSPELEINLFKRKNMRPFTPRKKPLPAIETVTNVRKVEVIRNLKFAYGNFPTYRCYKQLKAKFKLTDMGLGMQQTSESCFMLGLNHKLENQNSKALINNELIFTEKYKPFTTDQVLVNIHPVHELKSFLLNWKNSRKTLQSDYLNEVESGSDSSLLSTCSFVVLYGPSSSGKTTAVFALANEMNFNVLEINAGMKRNGKKLLQELQEATQSHIVKHKNCEVKDNADKSDSISLSASNPNMKQSLILIEDADIAFEQDSGFIEAIYQLARTSKRPVIIISNSATCLHLNRLQKHASIEFPTPDAISISKFLSIMSLVENCPIDFDQIIRLYLYNSYNLRKTILELQFFIQTGGDRTQVESDQYRHLQSPQEFSKQAVLKESKCTVKVMETEQRKLMEDVYIHKTLFDFFTRNQNSDFNVQFPVDYMCLHQNFGKFLSRSKKYNEMICGGHSFTLFEPRNNGDCLLQFYRNLSVACYLKSHEIEGWLSGNLQESIAHVLIEKAIRIDLDAHVKIDTTPRTKHTRQFLSSHLSKMYLRTNRSIGLDYDPMLRSICRSEKMRTQTERRGSRFYHYLRNICGNLNSFSTNMFESKCSVLSVSNKS